VSEGYLAEGTKCCAASDEEIAELVGKREDWVRWAWLQAAAAEAGNFWRVQQAAQGSRWMRSEARWPARCSLIAIFLAQA